MLSSAGQSEESEKAAPLGSPRTSETAAAPFGHPLLVAQMQRGHSGKAPLWGAALTVAVGALS